MTSTLPSPPVILQPLPSVDPWTWGPKHSWTLPTEGTPALSQPNRTLGPRHPGPPRGTLPTSRPGTGAHGQIRGVFPPQLDAPAHVSVTPSECGPGCGCWGQKARQFLKMYTELPRGPAIPLLGLHMLMAAVVPESGSNSCPTTNEGIREVRSVHTVEYHSARASAAVGFRWPQELSFPPATTHTGSLLWAWRADTL